MFKNYLKTIPQLLLPKLPLTILIGLLADIRIAAVKNALIKLFIKRYAVNMQEALEENISNYPSFNNFFTRHLKPDCRPLEQAAIICPVDGVISELGRVKQGQIFQAKGKYYTVQQLLANSPRSDAFINGHFATLYLSPKDYHRVHMPIEARLLEMIYIPGKLFSVQPALAQTIPALFARNERLVVFFETKTVGLMAAVLVGATIVGAIGTSWQGELQRSRQQQFFNYTEGKQNITLAQAAEMAYFKLGSTVVLLFTDQINWCEDLMSGQRVRFGQALGDKKI